ncbi:BTAD domain-containing putative transcriptional regulator [Streptomyces sp.]|uniref:BTAD domain-containing putative transcriptional regulator n=1 Tax=Streptomyces sp. TaxID=1931 RepID=UPI002D6582C0|nr:BTAD domain-containing putative transcriptional regulator [Streptomyces sp.]HZF91705.1 BTAD domain-containing putative transcriptional regulator [Streptomyces sp.]
MRFGVLGPLAVWTGDGELVAVPEAKVRALLAGLLMTPGQVVSVDRLVADLWRDGTAPARPSNSLHTLVSRLRRALSAAGGADAVVRRPPGYLLRVEPEAVDSGRFAALAARARSRSDLRERAELFAEALGLWRGPAFADFADEPFAAAAAAHWEEQRLLVREEYAETRLRLGEYGEAAADLAEAARLHPLRERLRAAQLKALHGAGRAAEALEVYQDVRRRLDEELGVEPGPELATLQRELLLRHPAQPSAPTAGGTVPALPRRRTNLPAPPLTGLVGRSRDIAGITALLADERLVTLTGSGGVGKTRLALEVASGSAGAHPDGVWLVELAGQARAAEPDAPAAVDALAEVVAAVLGIRDDARAARGSRPPGPPGSPARRLADALRERRLLLVLDNCEHVVEAAAGLSRTLLSTASGLRILATSRASLDLSGERLWEVRPLALPPPGAPAADVLRSDAVRLFAARAAAASPGFALTEADAAAAAAVCRRTDGIPLALELASTRVRSLGLTGLAARLDDRLGLLTGGPRDAPPRQQTLRAVIDWSWELLTAAERTVLRRLAVQADGCALEAAEALCSGGGVKAAEVLDLLSRLVDRSLVVAQDEPGGPRYRLLESVTDYCLERLRERPGGAGGTEYDELREAHARYYTDLAERAEPLLRGPGQRDWLRRLDAEAANFRAALDAAVAAGDAGLARRLVRALTWYWFLRGRLTEATRCTALALTLPAAPPETEHAGLVAGHTALCLLSGEPDSCPGDTGPEGGSPSAPPDYERLGDPRERARPGWFLGYATTLFGSLERAEDLVRRVLDDVRALDDRWGVAAALAVRGVQRAVRGDLAAARRDGEAALDLFGRVGDGWGLLQAGVLLGRLAEAAGDYAQAESRHREGLRIAEELGLWTEASVRRSELGRIALLRKDYALADTLHEEAGRLAVEHGDRAAQETAEVGLALSARRQGRPGRAEEYLRPWLAWNRRFKAANGTALILAELGFAAEQRGDAPAALALHREGLAAARRTHDPRAVALALEGLAGAHALAGRPVRAARLLESAARRRLSMGAPLPPAERGDVDRITAAVRAMLTDRTSGSG